MPDCAFCTLSMTELPGSSLPSKCWWMVSGVTGMLSTATMISPLSSSPELCAGPPAQKIRKGAGSTWVKVESMQHTTRREQLPMSKLSISHPSSISPTCDSQLSALKGYKCVGRHSHEIQHNDPPWTWRRPRWWATTFELRAHPCRSGR